VSALIEQIEQIERERTSKPTDGEVDAHDRLDSA